MGHSSVSAMFGSGPYRKPQDNVKAYDIQCNHNHAKINHAMMTCN